MVLCIPVNSGVIAAISSSRNTGRFSFPLPLRSTASFLAGEFFGAGSLRTTRAVDTCVEVAAVTCSPNTDVVFMGVGGAARASPHRQLISSSLRTGGGTNRHTFLNGTLILILLVRGFVVDQRAWLGALGERVVDLALTAVAASGGCWGQ